MKHLSYALVLISLVAGFSISVAPQSSAAREYKRLIALRDKLAKIPMEKLDREPNKSFVRRNKRDIVYSDPAGQWFVRSDRFWDLSDKNRKLAIADDIAWTAAENPLPGECEGYINCYLYATNATLGRYLKAYPRGRHAKQALSDLAESLKPFVTDRSTFEGPDEENGKAELQKLLAELQTQIAKVPSAEKERPLEFIKKLAEMYR